MIRLPRLRDEHELVVDPRGEVRAVGRTDLLLVRQTLPVRGHRPTQRLTDGGLDLLAPGAGVYQGIRRHVVDEALEDVVQAGPLVGVYRGAVEGIAFLRRLTDRRPGQLEEQHLAIARPVGVARHGQLAQRLAGKTGRLDRELFRFRRDDREAQRLRQIGGQAGAIAGHVGTDAMHHDHLENRAVRTGLAKWRIARLALEHRQDPGEPRTAHLAQARIFAGLLRLGQHSPGNSFAEGGAAREQLANREQRERVLDSHLTTAPFRLVRRRLMRVPPVLAAETLAFCR